MKIDNQDLLHQYYLKVRDKYPDLSFEQVRLCCITPFEFVKNQMESGELPSIRLKNFGTFYVVEGRAKIVLNKMEAWLVEGKITQEVYDEKKAMIEKYLKKHEQNKN